MLISVSDQPASERIHNKFTAVNIKDFGHFRSTILNNAWSPIVWQGGVRKGCNFVSARVCAVDVDYGLTTQEALDTASGLKIIIAPTKSHTSDKQRFRAIMFFEKTITDPGEYQATMKWAIDLFGGDACGDLGRFFYPSKSIRNFEGTHPVMVRAAEIKPPPSGGDDYQLTGRLPFEVRVFFKDGTLCRSGSRHSTIYYVARRLAGLGLPLETVLHMINEAPFSRKRVGGRITDTEIERTVVDAFNREAKTSG